MKESCEYYEELMSRRLDGPLTGPEEAALADHLRGCAECRRLWDTLSAATLSLRDETAEPPPGFSDGVMARVHAEGTQKATAAPRRWRLWPRLAAAACLAVVLGIGAYTALRGGAGGADRVVTESAEFMEEMAEAEPLQAPEPAPMPEEASVRGAPSVISAAGAAPAEPAEAYEAEAAYDMDAGAADITEGAAQNGAEAEDAAPVYTRDDPAVVPAGREAAFEALLRTARWDGGEAPAEDFSVIAAVEYRGVIYEFLTDAREQYLLWQDAAEGIPALSPGTVGELWDILY